MIRHGPPQNDFTKTLTAKYGPMADAVRAARCTHVSGDYWDVWPTVFVANAQAMDDGTDERVWGVTFRSSPTASHWRTIPRERLRVATFAGDPNADRFLPMLGTKLKLVERRGSLLLYVPE
jgi:hypothetical protein